MRFRSTLVVAALTAAALLAIAVSGAAARTFRVNERNFELIWDDALSGKTKFEFIFRTLGLDVRCKLTLLGRFTEATIKKETLTNRGTINHGELRECEHGTATVRTETMPWGLRYRSFTGTLPHVKSISGGLLGAQFRVREPEGLECEFGTEVSRPWVFVLGNAPEITETGLEMTGEVENIEAEPAHSIPLGGEFLCAIAGEVQWAGIGLVRNLPRTAKIRITLI